MYIQYERAHLGAYFRTQNALKEHILRSAPGFRQTNTIRDLFAENPFVYVFVRARLLRVRDMTRACAFCAMWHWRIDTWLIDMRNTTHLYVRHDSLVCKTCLIHMCVVTHSYVWHDSFICETCLIHMWDVTHSYVRHDSFICVTWLIHMWDMTHSYARHDMPCS